MGAWRNELKRGSTIGMREVRITRFLKVLQSGSIPLNIAGCVKLGSSPSNNPSVGLQVSNPAAPIFLKYF